MKIRNCAALLIACMCIFPLTGCSVRETARKLDAAEDRLENRLEAVEDAVEYPLEYAENQIEAALRPSRQDNTAPQAAAPALSAEQAKDIALEHAGYTADQVTGLHAVPDMDNGVLRYEVEFRVDYWEYDYDIHADNGTILSFDVDD